MNRLSLKHRLIAIVSLVALLCVTAMAQGVSWVGLARVVLVASLVVVSAWWALRRSNPGASAFRLPPRVHVIQRVGLTARSGLMLVEIDSQPFVVLHGEGFATLRKTSRVRIPVNVRGSTTSNSAPASGAVS